MRGKTKSTGAARLTIALALATLLLVAGVAMAQSSRGNSTWSPAQDYDLSWWTVDGGGITRLASEGGGYLLGGSAGQPDAGVLSGGGYTLGGGFWRGGAVVSPPYRVYLPLVARNW
jgi:hypothetical protein